MIRALRLSERQEMDSLTSFLDSDAFHFGIAKHIAVDAISDLRGQLSE